LITITPGVELAARSRMNALLGRLPHRIEGQVAVLAGVPQRRDVVEDDGVAVEVDDPLVSAEIEDLQLVEDLAPEVG
jgi:hypothetical protein